MHFTFRNVNQAFRSLVTGFYDGSIQTRRSASRVGEVLMMDEPVIITYTHPQERVLFNQARDCNPFFHLFESLWMLAGRNDVKPLLYYNPRMAEYSDDGETLNGAYGYRWRCYTPGGLVLRADGSKYFEPAEGNVDQLQIIVGHLRRKPESRRCVLQMWNVEDDLLKIDDTKDACCNTHAYFALRRELATLPDYHDNRDGQYQFYLDMTVCNRSNDLIWGMLGANAVHFSFLQEYLARCLGVEVGVYDQISNNLHVYTARWEPEKWLAEPEQIGFCETLSNGPPLVMDPIRFDMECSRFVDCIDGTYEEPFLNRVAQPMMAAFRAHKQYRYRGDNNALRIVERVWADDWRITGQNWIQKRMEAWESKNAAVCND